MALLNIMNLLPIYEMYKICCQHDNILSVCVYEEKLYKYKNCYQQAQKLINDIEDDVEIILPNNLTHLYPEFFYCHDLIFFSTNNEFYISNKTDYDTNYIEKEDLITMIALHYYHNNDCFIINLL